MHFSSPEAIVGSVLLIALVVALIPIAFFLLTLQNTLKAVSPENRKMPPANVWLMLIPFFGIVWQFIVVNRVADSLAAEFDKRGISLDKPRPGREIGLAYCILYCCSIIPVLGSFASVAGLVCWIIYWVKIAGFKNQLESSPALDSRI